MQQSMVSRSGTHSHTFYWEVGRLIGCVVWDSVLMEQALYEPPESSGVGVPESRNGKLLPGITGDWSNERWATRK